MTGRLSGVVAHDGPTKSCVSAAVLATVRSDQFAEWLTDWFKRACFRWHRSATASDCSMSCAIGRCHGGGNRRACRAA
jgi:hypothetical protein